MPIFFAMELAQAEIGSTSNIGIFDFIFMVAKDQSVKVDQNVNSVKYLAANKNSPKKISQIIS